MDTRAGFGSSPESNVNTPKVSERGIRDSILVDSSGFVGDMARFSLTSFDSGWHARGIPPNASAFPRDDPFSTPLAWRGRIEGHFSHPDNMDHRYMLYFKKTDSCNTS